MSYELLTSSTTSCSIRSMSTGTKQRITLFINPSIAKQARAQAIIEDLTLSKLVGTALINYLPKETIIKKTKLVE